MGPTIHLRRRQIFMIFDPYPPPSTVFYYYPSANLANLRPLPPKKCRRLKWMVPVYKSQIWTFLHHTGIPILIFKGEKLQNFKRSKDYIALFLIDPVLWNLALLLNNLLFVMTRRGKLCRKCLNVVDATPANLIGTAFQMMGETANQEVCSMPLSHCYFTRLNLKKLGLFNFSF